MPDLPSTFALLGLLLLARGFFALAEFAVRGAHKGRLQKLTDAGDARARQALATAGAPAPALSAARGCVTLTTLLIGALTGRPLVDALTGAWGGWRSAAWAAVVAVLTLAAVVAGEVVPRRIVRRSPDRLAVALAGVVGGLTRLLAPVVRALDAMVDTALRPFGVVPPPAAVTNEEVGQLMEQGINAGVFHRTEKAMVAGVLRLDELPVTALMTPRPRIVFLNLDDPDETNWRKIVTSGHSHFPVYQASRDQVAGMVAVKAIWANSAFGLSTQLKNLLTPPVIVPETMTAIQLLEQFKQSGRHRALVADEFGAIQGMVTLMDVLEAVVGDLPERGRREAPAVRPQTDGTWLVDATLPTEELKALLKVSTLPEEGPAGYQTLGGLVMTLLGRMPRVGDHCEHAGWRFEVLEMDRQRVDKVRVSRVQVVADNVSATIE
jgi:putative hemolysin